MVPGAVRAGTARRPGRPARTCIPPRGARPRQLPGDGERCGGPRHLDRAGRDTGWGGPAVAVVTGSAGRRHPIRRGGRARYRRARRRPARRRRLSSLVPSPACRAVIQASAPPWYSPAPAQRGAGSASPLRRAAGVTDRRPKQAPAPWPWAIMVRSHRSRCAAGSSSRTQIPVQRGSAGRGGRRTGRRGRAVGGVHLERGSGGQPDLLLGLLAAAAHGDEAAYVRSVGGHRRGSVRRSPRDRVRPLPCRRTGTTMRPSAGLSWSHQAAVMSVASAVTMMRS